MPITPLASFFVVIAFITLLCSIHVKVMVHAHEFVSSRLDSIQMATPLPPSINSVHDVSSILVDSIPSSLYTLYIFNTTTTTTKPSSSSYQLHVNPISIGDSKNIACLSCTSQAMIVYLVINSVGVSFQYKAQSLNNCPLEILQNFNPSNYTDSEAYHLPKISYSPQYTVSDIMNVTISSSSSSSGSSSSDMITLYGNLYQQNTLLHTVCMVIDASLSNQVVNNIYLNMAKNGSCPKVISSSAIGNTCKLSSDMKYVVEQVLVIRRK
ncbi:hypothetical protein C9374_000137 [Naegleria lovaniensis]|uniref:Uncharacterized protein n=1 Tax=Naegleria lovaniensis TaxID=51637 RepID=A0AA88GYG8_NAELO|nr:uncharacterized protein C9374_000137 [Naegleria lovaniensis]KAG2388698.1 hypothetical protein C9374_000137 [Naegleria lovaniensis]